MLVWVRAVTLFALVAALACAAGVAGEGPQTLAQRQDNVRRSVEHLRSVGY